MLSFPASFSGFCLPTLNPNHTFGFWVNSLPTIFSLLSLYPYSPQQSTVCVCTYSTVAAAATKTGKKVDLDYL